MEEELPPGILGTELEHLPYGSTIKELRDYLKKYNPEGYNDTLPLFNETLFEDECKRLYKNESTRLAEKFPDGFCEAHFDSLSCWPPTPLNSTAVVGCFSELGGIKYDSTHNATRECMWYGNWSKSDYMKCPAIVSENSDHEVLAATNIYSAGYSLSLVALAIAIGIFLYFKDLRCLRNTIHTNLMCAYMCVYFMWILTLILELNFESNIACIFLVILLHYFNLTTFFWMFVEGLYLYILVVETLTRENFKLRVYACIGWGIPIIVVMIWALVKNFMPVESDFSSTEDVNARHLRRHCPGMQQHSVDWIHQGPTIVVLVLNLLFLLAIMWVLITKLRSANTLETQQYRKAAKALLVLMPLLGVTYVLTITEPTTADETARYIYLCVRAVLLSTQGFTVALFYCFLNTEVQNTVKHHLETWKTSRSLGQRRFRSGSRSKDWSPRSRTESIRCQPAHARSNLLYKRPQKKLKGMVYDGVEKSSVEEKAETKIFEV